MAATSPPSPSPRHSNAHAWVTRSTAYNGNTAPRVVQQVKAPAVGKSTAVYAGTGSLATATTAATFNDSRRHVVTASSGGSPTRTFTTATTTKSLHPTAGHVSYAQPLTTSTIPTHSTLDPFGLRSNYSPPSTSPNLTTATTKVDTHQGSARRPMSAGSLGPPLIGGDAFGEVKAVVRDYEELLKLEREEYIKSLASKDKEVRSLKKLVNELEDTLKGKSDEVDIASIIRTKEEELRILFESRDRQIAGLEEKLEKQRRLHRDLKKVLQTAQPITQSSVEQEVQRLKRLVTHKESLLQQAETVAEARQQQYQALLAESAVKDDLLNRLKAMHPDDRDLNSAVTNKTAHQLNYLETEVSTMRHAIDELSFEKQELQQLLVQKDKHLAALSGIDTNMSESSAVQLSMQAISMVQSAVELKERIRTLEHQVSSATEDSKDQKEKFESTYQKLSEKRKECASLVETLATRDMRIARLDTLLQHRDKELQEVKEDARKTLGRERERAARLEGEVMIQMQQQQKLREELGLRDERIISLQAEVVRQEKVNEDLEGRVRTLASELGEAQSHLTKLVKQNVAKDRYMLELEKRMKETEIKRQANYLTEIAKNRRLQLDMRLREDDCRHALTDKEDQIRVLKSDLVNSSKQINAVRSLLLYSTTGKADPRIATESVSSDEDSQRNKGRQASHRPRAYKVHNGRRSSPDSPLVYRFSPKTGEVRLKGLSQTSRPGPSIQLTKAAHRASKKGGLDDWDGGSAGALAASLRQYLGSYSPVKGDPVDEAFGEFFNKPEYGHLRTLFCRLSQGTYLYGTQRVHFRLGHTGNLEGQKEATGPWTPIEDFVSTARARDLQWLKGESDVPKRRGRSAASLFRDQSSSKDDDDDDDEKNV